MSLAARLNAQIAQRFADVSPAAVALASARVVVAALLAFIVSKLLGLPEAHWAVMTVLIVARPDPTDSALQAGYRLRGTLLGSAAGVLAAIARRHGVADPLALAAMLAVLAPIASVWPELRAAPVAAIIVSSTGPHSPDALAVSALRLAEVAIGIAAALLVGRIGIASVARRERDALLARILRGIARTLAEGFDLPGPADAPDAEGLRRELRQLGVLARGKGQAATDAARALVPVSVLHDDLKFILRTRMAARERAERDSLQPVAAAFLSLLDDAMARRQLSYEIFDASLKQAALARAGLTDDASRERSVVQVFAFRRMRRQLTTLHENVVQD
jgi:uncharacterized membrane protein YccC